jgi:hypothetical protein
MSNTSERHRLGDTEFAEVLTLIKDADSVELKLTVPTLYAVQWSSPAWEPLPGPRAL